MKSISVKYFAMLKELAGVSEEEMCVTAKTYSELYRELAVKYSFPLPVEMIQVAVNDEFAVSDSAIMDGVKVVFIPPVAGG